MTAHIRSGKLSGILLADEFRPIDGAGSTGLVEEIHHGTAQVEVLVYLPVDTAEGFPVTVEIKVNRM